MEENNNLKTLPHPAQSPDLNPIENVWSQLKYKVNKRVPRPRKILEAERAIFEEWKKMDQKYINKLIEGMPKHVNEVIKASGFSTKY